MTALDRLYGCVGRPVPAALAGWEDRVQAWCDAYIDAFAGAELTEVNLDQAAFVFDLALQRVTLAYAVSVQPLMRRDSTHMRGFPNPSLSTQARSGNKAFLADKGHFLGHASGGELDINLFPHRRELNRGWSADGKLFRRMERYVEQHPGTFFYHRPTYDDDSWIPSHLEYGVLEDDVRWSVGTFANG